MSVLAATVLLAGASGLRAETLAIVGGTIIDGNGGKPIEHGVIVVKDRRILAVGGAQTPVPQEARRIDAAGKFVIPGLMDANVHLLLDYWPKTLSRYEGRYDELVVEAAQVALKNGLTTVFDSWGPRVDLATARDDIRAGRRIGARIYFAGNILGLNGPYSKDFAPQLAEVMPESFVERINSRWQENVGGELMLMPPEQVRKEVRTYLGKGVDFIKYAVNGHNFNEMPLIAFSARVQKIIVEEAHRAGVIAETHTTSDEGILMALDAGVDLMQHCDLTASTKPIAPEVVKRVAERRIPCAFLAHPESALDWFRGRPGDLRGQLLLNGDINERALIQAGALIVMSTDAGLFDADTRSSKILWTDVQPPEGNLTLMGEAHFNWLLAVEQKGMKPMDALLAATRNIARAYKVDKDLGTLEAHKLADLLILDRNPLESASNYRSISVVMQDGRIIDRQALPTQRLLTADSVTPPRD